jgi:D-aminopeptidase
MSCFEFKGGVGTASRLVEPVDRRASWSDPGRKGRTAPAQTYTIGVLALANFGRIERLTVDGVPVGRVLADDGWPETGARMEQERGSVIVVVATDAPLLSPALTRMATRAGLGLARTGSVAGHGSGDIFLAFSTGVRVPRGSAGALWTAELLDDEYLDPFFGAVVDATEASILDALFRADTVTGRSGHVAPGLPIERTIALLKAAGRISG